MAKKLFVKGKSGNPKGRPKGPSKSTIIRDKLIDALENDALDVVKSVIQRAKDGDMMAARIILDRLIPTQRSVDPTDGNRKPQINIIVNQVEHNKPEAIEAEVIPRISTIKGEDA